MEENRNLIAAEDVESVDFERTDAAESIGEGTESAASVGEGVRDDEPHETEKHGEREEYEALIKNRFKELYAEDTQRLINRRFRKYKVMEERYRLLEETLAQKEAQISESARRIAEFESLLASEVERAARETEERVIAEIRAKRIRPSENGALPGRSKPALDVSGLTKKERADLAKRAAGGERIKL